MTKNTELTTMRALGQLYWAYQNFVNRTINDLEITCEQWTALSIVRKNPLCNQKLIVDQTRKSKSAITQLVDQLVNKGLMTREQDPNNRRANLLDVTDRGRNLSDRAEKMINVAFAGHLKKDDRDKWDDFMLWADKTADVLREAVQ